MHSTTKVSDIMPLLSTEMKISQSEYYQWALLCHQQNRLWLQPPLTAFFIFFFKLCVCVLLFRNCLKYKNVCCVQQGGENVWQQFIGVLLL